QEGRACGPRPSSGAATSDEPAAPAKAQSLQPSYAAAPEDGRSPRPLLKFSPDASRLCLIAEKTLALWTVPEGGLILETNLSEEVGAVAWIGGEVQSEKSP